MATITQQIPNYHGGISQQADEVKAPGQVNKLKNAIPDVVQGLVKRPGTKLLTAAGNIAKIDNDKWFHYYRDETEQYIGRLDLSTGEIKMWDKDGTEKTVVYDGTDETAIKGYLKTGKPFSSNEGALLSLTQDTNGLIPKDGIWIQFKTTVNHGLKTGDPVKFIQNSDAIGNLTDGTIYYIYRDSATQFRLGLSEADVTGLSANLINYTSGDDTSLSCQFQTYIPTESDVQILTINDYTYLANRNKTVLMDTAATASLNPVRPPEAYIELKKVAYARQYAVNLFDDNTTQDVTTATRIKIEKTDSDDNDQCPHVDTQIFSINGFKLNDGTVVAFNNKFTDETWSTQDGVYSNASHAIDNTGTDPVLKKNAVKKLTLNKDAAHNNDHAEDVQDTNNTILGGSHNDDYFLRDAQTGGAVMANTNYYKLKNLTTGQQLISAATTGTNTTTNVGIYADVVTALKAGTAISDGSLYKVTASWAATTSYTSGDQVIQGDLIYTALIASGGTQNSNSTAPSGTAIGTAVSDGGNISWKCEGPKPITGDSGTYSNQEHAGNSSSYDQLPFTIEQAATDSEIINLKYKTNDTPVGEWVLLRCNKPSAVIGDSTHQNSDSDPVWEQKGRERPYQARIESTDGSYNGVKTTDVNSVSVVDLAEDADGNKIILRDLYFRLTTTGQSVAISGDPITYKCRYTTTYDLLHGGRNWGSDLNQFNIAMKSGSVYQVTIQESSTSKEQANLALVRPTPTSFDTKTTVTAESIIGSIRQAVVDAGNFAESEVTQVGNGLYINRGSAQTLGTITDNSPGLQFNITNHGFITGRNIRYTFTGTVLPSLTNNTNYWVIKNDNNSFWLATSYANAIAGTKIDHTGAIPAGSTHTFTPEKFGISTSDGDLLNVFTNEIQDVADLPSQCKHDYKLKVRNSEEEADDYYLKFEGQEKQDGTFLDGKGVWEECAEPGRHVRIDYSTMPVGLIRTADGNFRVTQFDGTTYTNNGAEYIVPTWADCTVGSWDSTEEVGTVPEPSFVGYTINKLISFRNRLGLLSDENVNLSRPGSFFNFWAKSAIAYSAADNIDVSCSSNHPAILYDGLQINAGLILFGENEQFMLTTDSDVLSPLTAKVNSFCTYNFNKNTKPISLGTTVGFLDNASRYSRFFEITSLLREGQPQVFEQSKIVSKLLPKDLTLITNSRENSTIFFAARGSHTIYGLKYLTGGDRRLQQAWFTWEMSSPVQHMALMDDALYVVLRDNFGDASTPAYKDTIQKITLRLGEESNHLYHLGDEVSSKLNIKDDDVIYPVHLDNCVRIEVGSLNDTAVAGYTTFNIPTGFNKTNLAGTYLRASGVATIGRNSHGFKVGQKLYFDWTKTGEAGASGDAPTDGEYTIIEIPNANEFKVTATGDNIQTGTVLITTILGAVEAHHEEDFVYNLAWAVGTTTNGQYGKITPYDDTGTLKGKVKGDWKGTYNTDIYIGYLFDMEVELPTIYPVKTANNNIISDYTGSLVVHRTELNLGQNGIYEVELERGMKKADGTRDKTTYSESIGPLTDATPPVVATDYYAAAYVMPLEEDGQQVIPIYEKNKNLTLTFKSTSPSPATLYSMTWEGDYTNNHYERVT